MQTFMMKVAMVVLGTCALGTSQDEPRAVASYLPNQTVRIHHVELRSASNTGPGGSLSALLQAIFHDPEVCCDKDSALQHDVELLASNSLQAVNDKLKGRHVMRDGRWVTIDTQYAGEASIVSAALISNVLQGQLVLLEWDSHVYLLKSVTFDETRYTDGTSDYVIRGMMVLDPQSKTKNMEVNYNRQKDDWGNIKSLLIVTAQKD
jgi:hypothetical protein